MSTNKESYSQSFDDLFRRAPLHSIPMIAPGETLYSWCARYHRISGSISAVTTSQRLFGSNTAGFVVDFPGRLARFFELTASLFDSPKQLIRDHTLFPIYAAFRPEEVAAKVECLMLGNSVACVKFMLGLPASRAATWHPLKYCPHCATEERNEHGIAHWWREHQWPSVWICAQHQTMLHYQPLINGRFKLTTWMTPDELVGISAFEAPQTNESQYPTLERLRCFTASIVRYCQHLRPDIQRLLFILRLRELGCVKPNGTFDWRMIQEAFLEKYSFLESLPGFDFIQGIRGDEFGILGPMLRGSSRIQHPTKYVLLIDLLFESPEQFFDLYQQYASTADPDLDADRLKLVAANTLDEKLRVLVMENQTSLNRAAKTLGISIRRVITWANRNNIAYDKRPRKTGRDFQMRLDKLLQEGTSRASIAEALAISRKWITTYLARHPTERNKWKTATLAAEAGRRRSQLLNILAAHPGANQKEIRSIPGNPFQWLKRNDRAWLKDNLPFFGIKD